MAKNNNCFFKGKLGKDPEIKHTPSGKVVSNFSIAVDENRLNKDTNKWEKIHTEWVSCVCWADLRYLKQGNLVEVTGTMKTRKWDKPDGGVGYKTEIQVWEDGIMVVEGSGSYKPKETQSKNDGWDVPPPDFDDDIPF